MGARRSSSSVITRAGSFRVRWVRWGCPRTSWPATSPGTSERRVSRSVWARLWVRHGVPAVLPPGHRLQPPPGRRRLHRRPERKNPHPREPERRPRRGGRARAGDLSPLPRRDPKGPGPAGGGRGARRSWWRCTASRPCSWTWRARGMSACSTTATHAWPGPSWRRSGLKAISSSGTTNPTPPAIRPTTPSSSTASGAGFRYVEIEIRQDLIADGRGQETWAERLARLLPAAIAALPTPTTPPSR